MIRYRTVLTVNGKPASLLDVEEDLLVEIEGSRRRVARTEVARSGLELETARVLVSRLAQPGDSTAPLPVADVPAYELADRLARIPPAELVDLVRSAFARRLPVDVDGRIGAACAAIGMVSGPLFVELALLLDVPLVRVALGAARGHDAIPPRSLPGHVYLGAFRSGGRLAMVDPVVHGPTARPISCAARPGQYTAWVSWMDRFGEPSSLLVVHADALASIDASGDGLVEVAHVSVDSGMVGVFDADAIAGEGDRSRWIRRQAEWGLPVEGVIDGCGVIVRTAAGDGRYPIALLPNDDNEAIAVRISTL